MLQHLDQFEFCRLRLRFDLLSAVELPPFALLRLRRDLRRAALRAIGDHPAFKVLFEPPVAADPVGASRYQRPGPAFVLRAPSEPPGLLGAGDSLDIDLCLFGKGIGYLVEFLACLEELGRHGLWREGGCFELGAVFAVDATGAAARIPTSGREAAGRLPIISGRWFLDSQPLAPRWRLVLNTPARLLVDGRPLFRGDLRRVVPFILRRVTSMAHAHCGLDLAEDPQLLLEAARTLDISESRLIWQDWRSLEAAGGSVDLGGLVGTVCFETPPEEELLSLLHLGSLLGIGKGAAYGAGNYRLEAVTSG